MGSKNRCHTCRMRPEAIQEYYASPNAGKKGGLTCTCGENRHSLPDKNPKMVSIPPKKVKAKKKSSQGGKPKAQKLDVLTFYAQQLEKGQVGPAHVLPADYFLKERQSPEPVNTQTEEASLDPEYITMAVGRSQRTRTFDMAFQDIGAFLDSMQNKHCGKDDHRYYLLKAVPYLVSYKNDLDNAVNTMIDLIMDNKIKLPDTEFGCLIKYQDRYLKNAK